MRGMVHRAPSDAVIRSEDHFVQLSNATWNDYQRVLELRGDRSAPRITYLEGELEIMSPSKHHERIKSLLGCLVEAYCLHTDITLMPYGSWTIQKKRAKRGAEPDECYVFGDDPEPKRPHLAIEVVWTAGGLDKLEVYRKLDVQEVWIWEEGKLQVHTLRKPARSRTSKRRSQEPAYVPIARSELLPDLDLELLVTFLDRPSINAAVRDFLRAL
jgi:Uma2 family endonuclease